MAKEKVAEDGSVAITINSIRDLKKFCDEMIEKGMGDYRPVIDFNWKYSLPTRMTIKENTQSILIK